MVSRIAFHHDSRVAASYNPTLEKTLDRIISKPAQDPNDDLKKIANVLQQTHSINEQTAKKFFTVFEQISSTYQEDPVFENLINILIRLAKHLPQETLKQLPLAQSHYQLQLRILNTPALRFLFPNDPLRAACITLDHDNIAALLKQRQEVNIGSGVFPDLTPLQIVLMRSESHFHFCNFHWRIEKSELLLTLRLLFKSGASPMTGAYTNHEEEVEERYEQKDWSINKKTHYHPLVSIVGLNNLSLIKRYFRKGGSLPQSQILQERIAKAVLSRLREHYTFLEGVAILNLLLEEGIDIQTNIFLDWVNNANFLPFFSDENERVFHCKAMIQRYLKPHQPIWFCKFGNYQNFLSNVDLLPDFLDAGFDPSPSHNIPQQLTTTPFFLESLFNSHRPTYNQDIHYPILMILINRYREGDNKLWVKKTHPLSWIPFSYTKKTVWELLSTSTKKRLLREGYSPTE